MPISLLSSGVFEVEKGNETAHMSLPEIMATLSTGNIESFNRLRPHQVRAWHCFLVQLAAVSLPPSGPLPSTEEEWRSRLLATGSGPETWNLVAEQKTDPAFFQPPLPESDSLQDTFKNDIHYPDDLGVLMSSTAHVTKPAEIRSPRPEHWAYALMTLQTTEGFLGRGYYGIARMNGGFGNRPVVTLSPDLSWGASFRRDLKVLRQQRQNEESDLFASKGGHRLLWDMPWDGVKGSGLPLSSLDRHFIEVCRRIRLVENPSTEDSKPNLTCWRTTTKGQRVEVPDSLNGRLEDPWTPVNIEEDKALTVGASGFKYQQVASIFFEDTYKAPEALQFTDEDTAAGQSYLVARTLVRGQGTTKGLKRRLIPIPNPDLVSENRDILSRMAEGLLQKCDETASSLLYPAVSQYAFGEDGAGEGESVSPLIASYSKAVNERFFPLLFESFENSSSPAESIWEPALLSLARSSFSEALGRASVSSSKHWRRRSKARDMFESLSRQVLPAAFD